MFTQLRELENKPGVTFNADELRVMYAEDWAQVRDNFDLLALMTNEEGDWKVKRQLIAGETTLSDSPGDVGTTPFVLTVPFYNADGTHLVAWFKTKSTPEDDEDNPFELKMRIDGVTDVFDFQTGKHVMYNGGRLAFQRYGGTIGLGGGSGDDDMTGAMIQMHGSISTDFNSTYSGVLNDSANNPIATVVNGFIVSVNY